MADQPIDLDRLQALHEAATPGLWEFDEGIGLGYVHGGGTIGEINYVAEGPLIVAMRNALPALIAEVRALRANQSIRDAEADGRRIIQLRDELISAQSENAQLRAERERTEAALRMLSESYRFSSSETPLYLHSLGLWREPKETP